MKERSAMSTGAIPATMSKEYGRIRISALVLAATPLGNPLDASQRLKDAIESAQIIAAEDSRRFHRLASDLGVTFTARIISFFEGNETDRTQEILQLLRDGKEVLVVTDAGMPTISDPGFRLMRDAIAEISSNHRHPRAKCSHNGDRAIWATHDRFTFEGFAPRAQGARTSFFENLRFEERTMVIFEAPHRLHESLRDAAAIFGRIAQSCHLPRDDKDI
jgi:16S rRNA (cytidine1402-2'-O)-methyltransferase